MTDRGRPHPWLLPLHRRIGVTVFCGLWLGFEIWNGSDSLWFWIAALAFGWAIWDFFLSGSYRSPGSR